MRASRLLSLLLTLQSRGRMTARDLADEFDVSIRTIYRDMDALAASGVPVYADRGPDGGYSLLEGYRPRLTGISTEEADTLARDGLPGVAAELGLGRVLAAAALKPTPALPAELSERATRIAERFHLDAPGWPGDPALVPTLTGVADAVWNQRVVRARHRIPGGGEEEVDLEPLGVVLKSGIWFVVAAPHGTPGPPRTYRVARVTALETLDARFTRPEGFDLWRHWHTATAYRAAASIRLSPAGAALAPAVLRPHTVRALAEHDWPVDDEGWTHATVPIDSIADARHELLALGGEVEVLAPGALREQMRAVAGGLASLYAPA